MKYPHLFSPIKLGSVTFRNRIFAAPTSAHSIAPPEYLKRESVAYYELRARGGAASVSLGDGIVHSPTGLMHSYKLQLDDPEIIPSISNTARSIRQHGAVPVIEFSHGGKYANVVNLISKKTKSLPAYGPDHEFTPEGDEILEMPEDVIETIVEAYGDAAKRAKMCGYGMIMIHGGHGWLLNQFISPKTNHRKDRFGGSLENRMRFALMALDSVRAAVGPNFPIEFRMSGSEFTEGGYDIEEGINIAKIIEPKVDLIHVSAGIHDNKDTVVITHPSMFLAHGYNVWLAARIKKEVNVPVATVGALNDPAQMEEIIASGKADIIDIGRALLADPFLPIKAMRGEEDKIVKCIRCMQCLNQPFTMRNPRCSVNPVIGRELDHVYIPPANPVKRILVIGGGPAGMEASHEAAKRGHDVTLCEAGDCLGGQLLFEEFVPFKRELFDYAEQKRKFLIEAGVDIRTNTKVKKGWAEEFKPDAIICAVGAEPITPAIEGIDLPHVKFLAELLKEEPDYGDHVVILGGGLVGCETAVHLLEKGKKVTVIEMLDDYAMDAAAWHKFAITVQLRDKAEILLNTKAKAITEEGVLVDGPNGEKLIQADTVFCAVGMKPREDIREEFRFVTDEFYAIGDCLRPGQMFQALSEGHYTGWDV